MADNTAVTKAAPVPSLTYATSACSYETIREALKKTSESPKLQQFDRVDMDVVRETRMKKILAGAKVEGTSIDFARDLAMLHWLRALPVVQDIKGLPAKHNGPFWLYGMDLCSVVNATNTDVVAVDENGDPVLPDLGTSTVLQRSIGFNYFATEILHDGTRILAIKLKPDVHFGSPRLPNVTFVYTHEDRPSYEDEISSLTRFPIEQELPVGLLLDE